MNEYSYQTSQRTGRPRWQTGLLVACVAGLLLVGWIVVLPLLRQNGNNWVFDRDLLTRRVESWLGRKTPSSGNTSDSALNIRVEAPVPVIPPAEKSVVGRLSIPKLGLHVTVREGTALQTLETTLGHIPGTALPGQNGVVGIAGPGDTLFGDLRQITPADEIRIETNDSVYIYRVDDAKEAKPEEELILRPGAYPGMTLVGCYPLAAAGKPTQRLVVRAHQVAQIPLIDASAAPPPGPAPESAVRESARAPRPVPRGTPDGRETTPPARTIAFEVARNRSRELAPGISLGLTSTDPTRRTVDAWLWLTPDKRAIWLRDQREGSPVAFETGGRPAQWKLVVTEVSADAMRGYLTSQ